MAGDLLNRPLDEWIAMLADEKSAGVAHAYLADVGLEALQPLMKAFRQPVNREMYEYIGGLLFRLGPNAVPVLVEELSQERSPSRALAANVLGRIGDQRAVPPLVAALQSKLSSVRYASVLALTELGAAEAVPAVTKRLRDRDHLVRIAAIDAVSKLGGWEMVDRLTPLLADRYPGIRMRAKEAIDVMLTKRPHPKPEEPGEEKQSSCMP